MPLSYLLIKIVIWHLHVFCILIFKFYHSHEEPVSREPPGAPPNTRAPSPQPQASAAETRLPYADPVPTEFKEMASPWIEVCF